MKKGKREVVKNAKVPMAHTEPVRYAEFKKGEEILVTFGRRKEGDYTVDGRGIFMARQIKGMSAPVVNSEKDE